MLYTDKDHPGHVLDLQALRADLVHPHVERKTRRRLPSDYGVYTAILIGRPPDRSYRQRLARSAARR